MEREVWEMCGVHLRAAGSFALPPPNARAVSLSFKLLQCLHTTLAHKTAQDGTLSRHDATSGIQALAAGQWGHPAISADSTNTNRAAPTNPTNATTAGDAAAQSYRVRTMSSRVTDLRHHGRGGGGVKGGGGRGRERGAVCVRVYACV
jgi:hypothetical protein